MSFWLSEIDFSSSVKSLTEEEKSISDSQKDILELKREKNNLNNSNEINQIQDTDLNVLENYKKNLLLLKLNSNNLNHNLTFFYHLILF